MTTPSLTEPRVEDSVLPACSLPENEGIDFFPSKTSLNALKRRNITHLAFTVCQSCPLVKECAANAVAVGEEYGIWGGIYIDPSNVEESHEKLRRLVDDGR